MKRYIKPEFEIIELEKTDIIQTSTLDTQGTTISTLTYSQLTEQINPDEFNINK